MCLLFKPRVHDLGLGVMGAKILLEIQESDLNILRWLQKITKSIIEHDNSSILRVLETLFGNILINCARHITSGDEFFGFQTKETSQSVGNLLLAVKSIILGARLSPFPGWVVLLGLYLSNQLRKRLDIRSESCDFVKNLLMLFGGHFVVCILIVSALSLFHEVSSA